MKIKNVYSPGKKLRMAWWLLRGRLIDRRVRLIRFPIDIRGRRFIDLGEGLTTGVGCRLEAFSADGAVVMRFGRGVQINDHVHISAMRSVVIGDGVLIAGRVYISDNSHGSYRGTAQDSPPDTPPAARDHRINTVTIGANVWLAEGVVVMPGVEIGPGSVIGANSVVTKTIPANSIAVGSPAKVIKKWNDRTKKWEPA